MEMRCRYIFNYIRGVFGCVKDNLLKGILYHSRTNRKMWRNTKRKKSYPKKALTFYTDVLL